MNKGRILVLVAITALGAATANASVVTQWNFNSTVPDANTATGVTTPAIGAGTASAIGGVNGTAFGNGDANGGSTDPAIGDDSGWQTTNYAAPGGGSGTAGTQYAVDTTGVTDILVNYDLRHSNTSSRFEQFQYSTDGVNFTSAGLPDDGVFTGAAGDTWFNARTIDLSAINAVENNANFAFRVVAVFDPAGSNYVASNTASSYAATGTWRFDMVTVNGTVPEPTSLAVIGLSSGMILARRRRA